jgi:hypothetical protein
MDCRDNLRRMLTACVCAWWWGMQPCYRLQALHKAIEHDLPPTPNGFIEVWSVILNILREQRR